MYRTATDALGLPPDGCHFVDDAYDCFRGALDLGCQAWGISRYGAPPEDGLVWIRGIGAAHWCFEVDYVSAG